MWGQALLLPVAVAAGYWIATAWLIARRRPAPAPPQGWEPEPVTFLRPIKRGVPRLEEKLAYLIAAAHPGDHLLFAVDNGEDRAVCQRAMEGAALGVRTALVTVEPLLSSAPYNPKIAKLAAMEAIAGEQAPQRCIVSDSEALPSPEWFDAFRYEWERGGGAALTVGYRFVGARSLPQQLDHLSALLTLWPGLMIASGGGSGSLAFTLGACTGLRRDDLAALGGWEAFLPYLAEDNRLGAALKAAGRPVRLSANPLTLDSDPLGWRDWLLHQHRVAVTYKVCAPAGTLGMIVTHGLSWSVLYALAVPGGWQVAMAMVALRLVTAWVMARRLAFPMNPGWRWGVAVVLASLTESLFWLAAWLPLPVAWGPRRFRVGRQGEFQMGRRKDVHGL